VKVSLHGFSTPSYTRPQAAAGVPDVLAQLDMVSLDDAIDLATRTLQAKPNDVTAVALAAAGAAGAGPGMLALLRTALEVLSDQPEGNPAVMGYRLASQANDPEVAQAVFWTVCPHFTMDQAGRRAVNDAELVLRLPAGDRSKPEHRLASVLSSLARLQTVDEDRVVLQRISSPSGVGNCIGEVGGRVFVAGVAIRAKKR
jgi:hypothetical protein